MADSVIRFGPFWLDRIQGLRHDRHELRVTPKALRVLWELASHAGDLVTQKQLFDSVWTDTAVSDSALTSCIQELRQALGDNSREPRFIKTVHRRGYRFIAAITEPAPEKPPPTAPDFPITGRRNVIDGILDLWSLAGQGARQVLFLGGEAGIGKTAVARHVLSRVGKTGAAKATWGQCLQHYGAGEPYRPLLEAIMRLCRQPGGAGLLPIFERCAPTWLAQLPALLDPERHASLQRTVAGSTRDRMLRELTDALEEASVHTPLLVCLEDLHWSDASTLDWIAAFAQRPEPAHVLLIGTHRPQADGDPSHPLSRVIQELRIKRCGRDIALSGMSADEVADFIQTRFPLAPGQAMHLPGLAHRVHRHTGGNPLYVLNVLDELRARGLISLHDDRWTCNHDWNESDLGTPDDVRRIIAAQLERLPPADCALLEIASVAGATFSPATVAGAAAHATEDVTSTLTRLAAQRRFVRQSGVRFEFDHVLYRDVLYERVPPARRATLHLEVARREESSHGQRAPEIAAELAMHFERGGDIRRAGMYLQHAAESARSRGAFAEARMHFRKSLGSPRIRTAKRREEQA
jgi:predicted ATPase/DNA-binding winged helix-turn-helix (wHTH) protein